MPKGQYERTQCRNGHPYEEGILPKRCKICSAAKYRRYNKAHPERVQKAQKTYRDANKEHYQDLWSAWYEKKGRADLKQRRAEAKRKLIELMGGVCQRCGSNPGDVAMHFDHVDPSTKTNMISNMLMTKGSWDALLDEVKKCQLLCSNCHALKTFDPEAFALYLSR